MRYTSPFTPQSQTIRGTLTFKKKGKRKLSIFHILRFGNIQKIDRKQEEYQKSSHILRKLSVNELLAFNESQVTYNKIEEEPAKQNTENINNQNGNLPSKKFIKVKSLIQRGVSLNRK